MEIGAVGGGGAGSRPYKQLYGVLPRLHLNKSSHSETALSNATFSHPYFPFFRTVFVFRESLLFHFFSISLSVPFSQLLTIEPFMWPHFETRRGRLWRGPEGARGDTEAEEEETKRGGVVGGGGGGWGAGAAFRPFLL